MIIDRFEGDFAIIEFNNCFYNIPKELLIGFKEGEAFKIIHEEIGIKRKENISNLMNDLFN